LIAVKTTPPWIAVALERPGTFSMDASRKGDTNIAELTLPSEFTPLTQENKANMRLCIFTDLMHRTEDN